MSTRPGDKRRAAAPRSNKRSRSPSPLPDSDDLLSSSDDESGDSDAQDFSELSTSSDISHLHSVGSRRYTASPSLPSTTAGAASTAAAATAAAVAAAAAINAAAASSRASAASAASATPTSATPTSAAASAVASTGAVRTFDPDECQPTRWPIFRRQHVVVRPPAADKTEAELADLTFSQWLDYYLVHPSFKGKRKHLLSDEHYCLLLDWVTSRIDSIAEFGRQRQLDPQQVQWLYHHIGDNTYQYSVAEYRGASVAELDKGPVLVTFLEPARKKGGKHKRRAPGSTTATTQGLQRVCVPYSYIERVLHFCHTGALASSMHIGQVAMWGKLSSAYFGISRELVRAYVRKCATCQQTPKRLNKAALVTISAKTMFERVVIDLINFNNKPSHGFKYILHAVDHFSKFHWAWALQDKRPATVAYHLNCLLADTGPIKHVQCDNSMEFVAEVLEVLADFTCGPVLNSAPYHPQTNGLVERGNAMLKTALQHWFIQENTEDWYPPLARIRYQLNCNKPRTTRYTPYELVYGKKPPEAGLNMPLNANSLARVLNGQPPTDAAADATHPAADPAASILSSMASGGAVTSPQRSQSLPNSQLPLPISHVPDPKSQLPDPEWELPAAEDSDIYPNVAYDLPPGVSGPVNQFMAATLNVGCHFVRLGGEGGGRCALSAFYNAVAPMEYLYLTSQERRRRCDDKRRELRTLWETMENDQRPASLQRRKALRDVVAEVWFSANAGVYVPPSPEEGDKRTPEEKAEARAESAWQSLGADLDHPSTSLGTETIALLAREYGVNVLLFLSHSEVKKLGKGTPAAVDYWRSATTQQKEDQLRVTNRKKGGVRSGWTAVSSATQAFIVPDPRYIVQDAPWIVIYQRTTAAWETSMVDKKLVTKTDEPNGHYEAVVKQTIVDGETQYQGVFRMDDDTANEYDQVLRVAKNLVAYINQQAASQQMADDFDRKSNIKEYRLLDSVGVRIAGKNPRRGNTPQCLPCLVVDVKVERRVVGSRTTVRRLYTVWCPAGVVKDPVKVDKLADLSINNFPALLELRSRLSAQQRLAREDPNWEPPMNALQSEPRITLARAWKEHLAPRTHRTEDQSRHRSVPSRAAADAASTSIAATGADARAALSLHTLTNQPAPLSGSTSPSRIVRILRANQDTYRVEWSQPECNGDTSWESRSRMDTQAEHKEVVMEWRRKEQQRRDNPIVLS